MECSEHHRNDQVRRFLVPRRDELLHKCRRRIRSGPRKGRWEHYEGQRTRMACPTQGCYNRPWLRHWRHMGNTALNWRASVRQLGLHAPDCYPAGHHDAWYRCLGCLRDIQIPPKEDNSANIVDDNTGIINVPAANGFVGRIP